MWILGLYKIIGDVATKCSLRQLSADHFKKTGRPFTVAVDEAHWRFHNVDAAMTASIRAGAAGANPNEKNILYRLFELQRLNIRVIMVTDGNDKPASKGKGNMNPELTRLLKQVCEALAVEWHQAPGEGEAECAALQRAGRVDAVWSKDSDAVMFGATVVIRDITEDKNGKNSRSKEEVLVLKMEDVTGTTGFTQKSCIAFALLAGCDYAEGLWNCREVLASKLALHGDLAEMLCDITTITTPRGRDFWRRRLNDALLEHNGQASAKWLQANPRYPKPDIIKACVQPSVSSAAVLQRLPLEPRPRTTADIATAIDFLSGWFNRNGLPTWPVTFLIPGEVNNRCMIAGQQPPGAALPPDIPIQLKRRNDLETSVVIDPRSAPRATAVVVDLTLSSSPPKVRAVFDDDQENRTRPVKRIFVPDFD
ncbi:PIN domain-like protein [Plectosphaerella plurivora]|uniref:PIN domain-like protein n=1 Tax=Plectosphaerella plurivora TaxID=936078 RepID=A0A9P9A9C1_9PEZI|nr:PIN domain-like protein [Plectosphaerella plurivora]